MEEKKEVIEVKGKTKMPVEKDKIIILSIVIGMLLLAFGLCGYYFYQSNLKSIATFKGGNLTVADYTIYYKVFYPILAGYGYPENMIPSEVANKAVTDKVVLMLAKAKGMKNTAEDIEKVEQIMGDETELSEMKNRGINPTQMKQLYLDDYLIGDYLEFLAKELSKEEVLAFLKETYGKEVDLKAYETSHILLRTVDSSTGDSYSADKKAEVKAKAQAILDKVKAGEDFATLAKENSEDTGTKASGGKYTMYTTGTVEEYKNAVLKLKEGEYTTELVETEYGYHIIKLDKFVAEGRLDSTNDRMDIVNDKLTAFAKEYEIKIDNGSLAAATENITGKKVEIYGE